MTHESNTQPLPPPPPARYALRTCEHCGLRTLDILHLLACAASAAEKN